MEWLTYAAYAAMLAVVLPLILMTVGYLFVGRRRKETTRRDKAGEQGDPRPPPDGR